MGLFCMQGTGTQPLFSGPKRFSGKSLNSTGDLDEFIKDERLAELPAQRNLYPITEGGKMALLLFMLVSSLVH